MQIVTLAERPDLAGAHWDLVAGWPSFMLNDPVADLYYSQLEYWAEHVILAVDEGAVVARGLSVGFAMGEVLERPFLPDDGWDGVVRWSWLDQLAGRAPTDVSALEVVVRMDRRGAGLATRMVEAMIENIGRLGFERLVAPVRPSDKHLEPSTPMEQYVRRVRDDGLPADTWMRIHARLGASVESVCPTSMTISGTLAQWRSWTGLPFDQSGEVRVPGGLVPVHVDVSQDHAVYVEPNVWMVHHTRAAGVTD
jgi:GNAT superfamily N-acetyltransferase